MLGVSGLVGLSLGGVGYGGEGLPSLGNGQGFRF